jgi:hypothetical protein
MKTPFLKPEEVRHREEKVPVSARISRETRSYLERKAREAKISVSNLISHTLESYSSWLQHAEEFEYGVFDIERVKLVFQLIEPIMQYEFDDYMSTYEGSILYAGEGDQDSDHLIGKITVRLWHLKCAMNNGEAIFPIFDHEDADTAEIYEAVIDPEGGFREGLVHELNLSRDLMYIEGIEIVPEFRGKGLGHFAVLRSMQKLGQACGAAVISPVPWVCGDDSSWKERLMLKSFTQDQASAEKKLRRYWGKIGFEPTFVKTFLIYDMDELPLLADLFKKVQ